MASQINGRTRNRIIEIIIRATDMIRILITNRKIGLANSLSLIEIFIVIPWFSLVLHSTCPVYKLKIVDSG